MTSLPTTRVLQLKREGAQLFVTMNDPTTRNALSATMLADLEAVLAVTRDDRTVRALVLQGRDGMFCAGGHLKGALAGAAVADCYTSSTATPWSLSPRSTGQP
jgi:isohexenylglutaconyl-CoA hydratase